MKFATLDKLVRLSFMALVPLTLVVAFAIGRDHGGSWINFVGAARKPLVIVSGVTEQLPDADYLTSIGGASFNGVAPIVAGDVEVSTLNNITLSSFSGSSGSNNIWIGGGGAADTSGANNSSLGINTLFSNTTGTSNTAIGINTMALNTTGNQNTGIGGSALTANTSGSTNSAIGASALASNTSGSNNTGLGVSALQHNTTGSNNTASGVNALITNTIGISNSAFGINALATNDTASNSSAFGAGALELSTGAANSAFGFSALINNTSGHDNIAFGSGALGANTVGIFNTALGGNAAVANTTGTHNIAIGQDALSTNTTGNQIIAIGLHSLQDLNITDNSNNNNTALGYNTGRGIVTGANNVIIGPNVTGLAAGLSGQIIIADGLGNQRIQVDSSAHTTLAGNVQIMATGATWTSGTGVPAISCTKGDMFSRTDGGVGTTLYTCTATNTWTGQTALNLTLTHLPFASPDGHTLADTNATYDGTDITIPNLIAMSSNSTAAVLINSTSTGDFLTLNASGPVTLARITSGGYVLLTPQTLLDSSVRMLGGVATMPTVTTAARYAVSFQAIGAGSSSNTQAAQFLDLAAGYTGSSPTYALLATNESAGTGTANGIAGYAAGASSLNVGVAGRADGGTQNCGVFGTIATGPASGRSAGVCSDVGASGKDLFLGTTGGGAARPFQVTAAGAVNATGTVTAPNVVGSTAVFFVAAKLSSGAGAASGNCNAGDLYTNTSGGVLTTLYVCTSANTWTAK